ncbi:MAG: pyridoxal phosphate-dependent aminotransferase [Phascolarctobacterium sp.]|nr:pyridoxal phosphate-dependent aminotransferase [Phascolarctobacterium sp.]
MLAERMKNFSGSATVEINNKVAELKAQGKEIIGLNVGEPDFDTPDYIKKAAIAAMMNGFNRYTQVAGIPELRNAIANKLEKENNIVYKPSEISVAAGAKQSIFNAVMALVSEGDEVIVPTPCWVSYTEIIKLACGVPVLVPADEKNGFDLDIEAIKAAVTAKTKAIIICTPNNPTGAIYKEATLRALAALAVEKNFYIIADEIYEKLSYDGEKHFSVASVSDEVKAHTITINGFSKAYAMTGWRLGYAAAASEVIAAINKIQSQTVTSVNSVTQKAGVEALEGPQSDLNDMVVEFARRRIYVLERLCNMPNITCVTPKGAFYALPDVSSCFGKSYKGEVIKNAVDFCRILLTEKLIALVPGEAFYAPGKVRISYSNSMENLEKAMDKMEEFIKELA